MIKEEFTKEEITEALLNIRYLVRRLHRRLDEVNRLVLDSNKDRIQEGAHGLDEEEE